jgi:NitT/TauT family transport system substrate-binding protein
MGIRKRLGGAAVASALCLLFLVSVLISGCGQPTQNSGLPVKMRLGLQPGPQSTLIWVAQKQGFFKKHGLDVTLRQYDVGFHAVRGLGAGETDVATGTEFAFISNAFSNPDLRVVASIAEGDTTSIVARRNRGIGSAADLAGKRVAVTPGVINQFYLGKFLTLNGIDQKDITTVNMDEASAKKAVEDGTVDAAVLFEPDVQDAKNALGSNGYAINVQSGQDFFWLLGSTTSYVNANKEAVKRLLAAMIDAQRFTEANPAKARQDMQTGSGLSAAYARYIWPKFAFEVALPQSLILAMEDEARWTVQNSLFGAKVVPDYLNSIYQEGLRQLDPQSVTIY